MNRGKTTVALGLLAALIDRGLNTGFIKPVGQRYDIVDGQPADEDAILMRSALGLPDPLAVMSPVHIPRGFTRAYISGEETPDLPRRIRRAHAKVGEGREALLIEGTGHAGVGAVEGPDPARRPRTRRPPPARGGRPAAGARLPRRRRGRRRRQRARGQRRGGPRPRAGALARGPRPRRRALVRRFARPDRPHRPVGPGELRHVPHLGESSLHRSVPSPFCVAEQPSQAITNWKTRLVLKVLCAK